MKLILASASPQKKSLLNKLGIPFEIFPTEIDKTPIKGEKAETKSNDIIDGEEIFSWNNLLDSMEDEQFCRELVMDALKTIPARVWELKKLLTENDMEGISFVAHSLKGATGVLCASLMNKASRNLEEKSKEGQREEVVFYINLLEKEFQRFYEKLCGSGFIEKKL